MSFPLRKSPPGHGIEERGDPKSESSLMGRLNRAIGLSETVDRCDPAGLRDPERRLRAGKRQMKS